MNEPAQKKKPVTPRHRARAFALQGLYQHLVGGQDEASIRVQAESVAGFERIDHALYDSLLTHALNEREALSEHLLRHLSRSWAEVSPIEKSILLIAVAELIHHPETPYRVILDEAVELAKEFGAADGHKFVNGVLDKLAPTLRPYEAKAR